MIWVAFAVGSLVLMSLLVGFAVARILGTIARNASALYENDVWSSLPTTRMPDKVERVTPVEGSRKPIAAR
jgi:hypothetical protein